MPTLQATKIAFALLYLNFHTVRFYTSFHERRDKFGIPKNWDSRVKVLGSRLDKERICMMPTGLTNASIKGKTSRMAKCITHVNTEHKEHRHVRFCLEAAPGSLANYSIGEKGLSINTNSFFNVCYGPLADDHNVFPQKNKKTKTSLYRETSGVTVVLASFP